MRSTGGTSSAMKEQALSLPSRRRSDTAMTTRRSIRTALYIYEVAAGAAVDGRANWNFDFSATTLAAGDSDTFDFKLLVDTDKSDDENFVEFDLTSLAAVKSGVTEQGSQNFGFNFYTTSDRQ